MNMPVSIESKRKNRNSQESDKKYEIRSMEELFLDEEEEKNVNINVDLLTDENELNNEKEKEIILDEEILNSFENLSEEDFKNLGSNANVSGSNMSNTNLKQIKLKIPGLDKINEYLIKSHTHRTGNNNVNTNVNNNSQKNLTNILTGSVNINDFYSRDMKIEEYPDIDIENNYNLENDYNNIEPHNENTNKQYKYEEDKIEEDTFDHIKTVNMNNLINNEEDDDDDEENNDLDIIDSLGDYIDDDYESKLEKIRLAKSKRPPTRYGNREDQVLWSGSSNNNNKNLTNNFTDNKHKINSSSLSPNGEVNLEEDNKNKSNFNSILKNKNKIKQLSQNQNRQGSINNSVNNINIKPMNNTFNDAISDRLHFSNYNNNMSRVETMAKDRPISNVQNGVNSYHNKKIIHNLHDLQNRINNTIQYDHNNNAKISSEFRKTLKMKLTKNTDKIFANLKRLTNINNSKFGYKKADFSTSRISNQENNSTINRAMSNPDLFSTPGDVNIENYNDYDLPMQQKPIVKKGVNYNINTNLTESKYLGNILI